MEEVIHSAQWILVVEVILVILLVILTYLLKAYYHFKNKFRQEKLANFSNILSEAITDQKILLPKDLHTFSKNIPEFLITAEKFKKNPHWPVLKKQLSENFLHATAVQYAKSRNWFKRYLSLQCFNYGYTEEDIVIFKSLIRDKILLIALNTAKLFFIHPSYELINDAIDYFSQTRRLQRSALSEILTKDSPLAIRLIIIERIQNEPDPYVKAFCYNLLSRFSPHENDINFCIPDLAIDNIELKMTVTDHISHINSEKSREILRKLLSDDIWEIRAKAATSLGNLQDTAAITALADGLHDSAWWVRLKSAEALSKLGPEGMIILENQNPEIDKYAFEAATEVLTKYKQRKRER